MQNPHVKWRIKFAEQLVNRFLQFKGIKAIVIAGSVARGWADAYSDIEIPIFWDALPDDVTRHHIAMTLNASFLYAYDGPSREDQLLIDEVQVDLWHIPVSLQEEILDAVLNKHQFDLSTLNALDTMRSCIPLYGHELIQKWKHRAEQFPDELAKKIIQEHLANFSLGELFLLAKRDNPTAFYSQLSFLQQEAFIVLLALNRMYFPTFKWLYPSLESMQIKPNDISGRYQNSYQVPYKDAIAGTKLILAKIVHLVKEQFPQMDMTIVNRMLLYTRNAQNVRE